MHVQTRRVTSRPWRSRAVALVRRFDAHRPGGASDDLRRARALLDQIENERNRLASQRMSSTIAGKITGLIGLSGFRDRVASTDALISQLEDFVASDFPRMEAKAIAGDDEQAARLVRGCERILAAARGTSMVDDAFDDARSLVVETIDELKAASQIGLGVGAVVVGVGAAAYVAFMMRR